MKDNNSSSTLNAMRYTPPLITALSKDEYIVFGSNTEGRHGKGAALQAFRYFGAKYGHGEGITGQCYAFPTLDGRLQRRSLRELELSRDLFYAVAQRMKNYTFLLTKVGTGLAGYSEEFMKGLFTNAPANVVKPKGW